MTPSQPGLFDAQEPAEQLLLDANSSWVRYFPRFLPRDQADALLAELLTVPTEAERPVVRGQAFEVKRRSVAFGNPGLRYRYAGIERPTTSWPMSLEPLLDELFMMKGGAIYNFCLLNLYPDGTAGLGWHADREGDLVPGAPIASVSLGAERDFQLRPAGDALGAPLTVKLRHGSLLIMGGWCQRAYEHCVPKRQGVKEPRVNLTFRVVRPGATGERP